MYVIVCMYVYIRFYVVYIKSDCVRLNVGHYIACVLMNAIILFTPKESKRGVQKEKIEF